MQISKTTGYVYFGHARVCTRPARASIISGAKENPFARLAFRFGIQAFLPLTHSARFKRSFRRKLAFAEKGEIHSVKIGSVVTNRRSPTTREREKVDGDGTTMMKQMPRSLSHVIDVHHRARRKPNIARRHINIYTPGRAVLMQPSFFFFFRLSSRRR